MSDNSAFENPKLVQIIYGDVPAFMGQPYKPDLTGVRADAVVVGMPYDGIATLRGGATRLGPSAIRKISLLYGSYNLDWDFDVLQDFRHRVIEGLQRPPTAMQETIASGMQFPARWHARQAADITVVENGGFFTQTRKIFCLGPRTTVIG